MAHQAQSGEDPKQIKLNEDQGEIDPYAHDLPRTQTKEDQDARQKAQVEALLSEGEDEQSGS